MNAGWRWYAFASGLTAANLGIMIWRGFVWGAAVFGTGLGMLLICTIVLYLERGRS